MRLLRNLGRRKLRTALTVTGITIGIWALVVFGATAVGSSRRSYDTVVAAKLWQVSADLVGLAADASNTGGTQRDGAVRGVPGSGADTRI